MDVRFGVDRLCDAPSLLGPARRVGLVTNDAARLASDVTRQSRVALRDAGVQLVQLFGPEHGLAATAADGASVDDSVDRLTGLPVTSLYGARMRPSLASLRELDTMIFDVPDVGARCYTYTWTLYHTMAACAEAGVPLVVLDRPNPLGGDLPLAEGPMLDKACRSFIGEDNIPLRHQLTLGELALLWRHERFPGAPLRVLSCDGWRRDMRWPETGLPWVPTSPAMPTFECAELYPGLCLFEATNLSVGRGTEAPFQQIGAPWLDAEGIVRQLTPRCTTEVEPQVVTFTPLIGPYAGEPCHGVRLRLAKPAIVRPVALGLLALSAIVRLHPEQFRWTRYPTAANPDGNDHFERLSGRTDLRHALEHSPELISDRRILSWTGVADWHARVRPHLRYP